ncbi:MAG: rhodanese-like domain-containing protein [Bacteroidetes bacterium]|nr:MAG: rhodanese-like domain-containing protein [Bacteroidota bacterium]
MKTAKEICPGTTRKLAFEGGALIVDVREPEEVAAVRMDVPDYLHIPLLELETRYREIPTDRPVVFVCQSGMRSLKATYFLMNHGYDNVMNMRDGLEKWQRKGYPVVGEAPEAPVRGGGCCGTAAEAATDSAAAGSSCCGSTADDTPCC